jgi:hypothetical protein
MDAAVTGETTKRIADALAQRVGLAPEDVELVLNGDPIHAVLALSLLGRADPMAPRELAGTVRRVGAIVGACARCLGTDDACSECAGTGKPGMRAPDRDAFLAWIALPLRRLGLHVSGSVPHQERFEPDHEGGFDR